MTALVAELTERASRVVGHNPHGLTFSKAVTLLALAHADRRDLVRVENFLLKVAPTESGCLLWKGSTAPNGYGKFGMGDKTPSGNRRPDGAHRASYRLFVGPIPDGLELDHLCRVTGCVHPFHLEAVTHHENLMRGNGMSARYSRQTTCLRGHLKTSENIYFYKGKARGCRPCMAARDKSRVNKGARS